MMNDQSVTTTGATDDVGETEQLDAATRATRREHARRLMRASGVPELLLQLNRHELKGRGTFDEYETGVIFRWGSGYTRRHIWVDVAGEAVRIRLREHLRCRAPIPACDGEYHSFTAETWGDRTIVEREIRRAFERPVAETSED
jgi:hypothetical protein